MNQNTMLDQITREEAGKKLVDRAQVGEVWRRIRRYLAEQPGSAVLKMLEEERKKAGREE